MLPASKLTALLGANMSRLLLVYYVMNLSHTPLLLALSFSVVTMLASGVKLWMCFEGQETVSIELIIFQAIEIITFYVSSSKVDPTTYAIITLCLFSISNIISSSRSRIFGAFCSIVGSLIFCLGTQISLQILIIAVLSNYIAMETRNLSARTSSPKVTDNFGYAVLVTCVAILTSADERQLFTYGVSTNNTLLLLWTLATVAQWIFKRAEQSEPYTDMVMHTITAVVVALVTLGGMHLAIALVATAVLFVAAYSTVKPSNEQLVSTEHVPRARNHRTTSYWTIGFVVIAFTFIMYTHVNWFNTRDLRAPVLPGLNSTIDYNDHNMPEGERKMYRLQCLHKTRSSYIEMLSPYFRRGRNYTILDYPNHWNLGDAFIYVGQDIMFSVYGQVPLRPPYPHVSTIQLQRGYHNITEGVIFLHGGGNFGDIYPYFDNYRTRITSTFKNHSIVMLPQSVHYKDPKRLARMVIAYRHKDLTMMLRDHESQMYVQGNFTYAKAPYVPDSAFMIGPQLPNSDPVVDVFYLLRLDHEIAINYTMYNPKALAAQYGLSAEVWDFPLSFPVHIRKNKTVLQDMADIYPGRLLNPKLLPSTEAITWYRTQMGNTMLSRGRVVIADRLHASIMATLIGRPVVYVDNNYRKTTRVRSSLTQFIPECTDTVLDAHYAPDLATAVKIAADLIKKMEPNRL